MSALSWRIGDRRLKRQFRRALRKKGSCFAPDNPPTVQRATATHYTTTFMPRASRDSKNKTHRTARLRRKRKEPAPAVFDSAEAGDADTTAMDLPANLSDSLISISGYSWQPTVPSASIAASGIAPPMPTKGSQLEDAMDPAQVLKKFYESLMNHLGIKEGVDGCLKSGNERDGRLLDTSDEIGRLKDPPATEGKRVGLGDPLEEPDTKLEKTVRQDE